MDQQNNSSMPSPPNALPIHPQIRFIIIYSIIWICIAILCSILGYRIGMIHVQQLSHSSQQTSIKKKQTPLKPKTDSSSEDSSNTMQPKTYTLLYTIPTGWRPMLWHITDNGAQNALLAPDYTSIADPEPQTGMSIIIYQFPGTVSDMQQLRPIVEQTEDGLQHISETTIDGFPTWYAIFQCTDGDRVLYDYHILKDHDHWVVRLIFPGISLQAAQEEAQKYNYQINEFLQSIQFKTSQYQ